MIDLNVLDSSIVLFVLLTHSTVSGSLSPPHGASSGCGWRKRPPDTEGSCEYI